MPDDDRPVAEANDPGRNDKVCFTELEELAPYDAAGNLQFRTNGALIQTFNCDPVNELTNITRSGTLTVSGNTPEPATNVTVNGSTADRYGDFTFA